MRVPRIVRWSVGLAVMGSVALGLLTSLGVRHRHQAGHVPHAHEHSGGSAHTHSHATGTVHHHDHTAERDVESATATRVTAAPTTHVHVSLFGYLITLPDLFADDDAAGTFAARLRRRETSTDDRESVQVVPPSIPGQIVTLLFDLECVLWSRSPRLPGLLPEGSRFDDGWIRLGADAPAPLRPPPRLV